MGMVWSCYKYLTEAGETRHHRRSLDADVARSPEDAEVPVVLTAFSLVYILRCLVLISALIYNYRWYVICWLFQFIMSLKTHLSLSYYFLVVSSVTLMMFCFGFVVPSAVKTNLLKLVQICILYFSVIYVNGNGNIR